MNYNEQFYFHKISQIIYESPKFIQLFVLKFKFHKDKEKLDPFHI
jgi:hypothetical protein